MFVNFSRNFLSKQCVDFQTTQDSYFCCDGSVLSRVDLETAGFPSQVAVVFFKCYYPH